MLRLGCCAGTLIRNGGYLSDSVALGLACISAPGSRVFADGGRAMAYRFDSSNQASNRPAGASGACRMIWARTK